MSVTTDHQETVVETEETVDRRTQLLCVWTGPALIVLFLVGCIPLADFIPPPSPTAGSEEIATIYRENTDSIRLGCLLMIVGLTLIAPWGATIAMWTRRMEKGYPVLTYTQVACIGASLVIVILIPLVWAVAAYRPADVDPDITRMLNDTAWFLFLFSWPPFSVWCVAIALAILRDRSEPAIFPRWAAYFNLWVAFLLIPAGMMAFFKTGPFAFNGLLAMYLPLAVFFIWMIGMTVLVIRAINREAPVGAAADAGAAPSRDGEPAAPVAPGPRALTT